MCNFLSPSVVSKGGKIVIKRQGSAIIGKLILNSQLSIRQEKDIRCVVFCISKRYKATGQSTSW